jgi:hypothetical protein
MAANAMDFVAFRGRPSGPIGPIGRMSFRPRSFDCGFAAPGIEIVFVDHRTKGDSL